MKKSLRLALLGCVSVIGLSLFSDISIASTQNCACSKCVCTEQKSCGCSHQHGHTSKKSSQDMQHPYIVMMDEMMIKMHKAEKEDMRCTDTNFLVAMLPHHEGALVMSEYELKHGKNPTMLKLAKDIIKEQKKEIALMKALLKEYKSCPKGESVTEEYQKAMAATMKPMMQDFPTEEINKEKNPDRAFALAMMPHHQAAVDMAIVVLKYTSNPKVKQLAENIIKSQNIEIKMMKEYINKTK